jgi:hypothetical protein
MEMKRDLENEVIPRIVYNRKARVHHRGSRGERR